MKIGKVLDINNGSLKEDGDFLKLSENMNLNTQGGRRKSPIKNSRNKI